MAIEGLKTVMNGDVGLRGKTSLGGKNLYQTNYILIGNLSNTSSPKVIIYFKENNKLVFK